MTRARQSLARLLQMHPRARVESLERSGRHGTRTNPDATLGWALDRLAEHEERRAERLPYKDPDDERS